MARVIKIIIGILVFLFGIYMFLDDSRREIKGKLTKKEINYFDIIEIWFYVSNFIIVGLLWGSFSE